MRRMVLLSGVVTALLAFMSSTAQAQQWNDRPVVHSVQALDVTTTSAKFRASATYYAAGGGWWFSYCPVGACETEEETAHQFQRFEIEADSYRPHPAEWPVSGLVPNTRYRVTFHADTDNWQPPQDGHRSVEFTTAPTAQPATPVAGSATTGDATAITASALTLNGTAVPGTTNGAGINSSWFFEYGEGLRQSTPPQTLPADANPYPVASGLAGLTPNTTYSYRLVVVRNGVRFQGATRTTRTAWAPTCSAGNSYQTVVRGRIQASGCFRVDGTRYVADGDVRLNGLLLHPVDGAHTAGIYRFRTASSLQSYLDGGNRFYIDVAGRAIGTTGVWTVSADDLPGMALRRLDFQDVQWDGTRPLASLGAEAISLFGFPLAGQLTMTPRTDGSTQLAMLVAMPVPGAESVTGEAAVRVNPSGDLAFDRLLIEVAALPIRNFELGSLRFLYDREHNQWEGSAEVQLPTASRVRVAAAVTVSNGQFGSFTGSVDGINQHIAYGVYLQKLGVDVGIEPEVRFGGTIGLSAGPMFQGVGIFGVEGSFSLAFAGGNRQVPVPGRRDTVTFPGSISVSGVGSVAGIPVRKADATWYFSATPWFHVGTEIGVEGTFLGARVFGVSARFEGELYGTAFDLSAQAKAWILRWDVANASLIANTKGVAGCGYVRGFGSVGAYKPWRGEATTVYSCDMGELRTALNASASAAAATQRLTLPAGDRALVRFSGDKGAPQVRLHGPGGRTIDTPASGQVSTDKPSAYLTIRDDAHGYTDVLLINPGKGWTYETLPGSTRVKGVKTAAELPELDLHAKVRRIGGRAELSWTAGDLAGRKITLMESGPGAPARVLAKTTASSGKVRFTPYLVPERNRQIVAIVELNGLPLSRKVVARYTAPALGKVAPVRGLRAVVRGGKVRATWKSMPAAARFRVIAGDRSGARTLRTVKRPAAVLPKTTRNVTVVPVGWDGKRAAARRVTVK